MRARSLLAGAVAASVVALPGLVAVPAHAACLLPCGGALALTAPASIGIGGDWTPVTLTQTGAEGSFSAPVNVELDGDVDIDEDAVLAQVNVEGTWTTLDLTEVDGNVRATTPALTIGSGTTAVEFRIAASQPPYSPFDPDASLTELTFGADYAAAAPPPPPPLAKPRSPQPQLDGPDAVHATMDVLPLDVTSSPKAGKATIGKAFAVSATVTNPSASAYQNVAALPILPGAQHTPFLRRPVQQLRKLAAETETTVEFKKDGRWIDFADTAGPNDVVLSDLAPGASRTVQWRFTFRDKDLIGDSAIGWLVGRFAPPLDDVESDRDTLVPPDAGVVIAGFGVTEFTLVNAAAAPPKAPTGPGGGSGSDDDGDDGSGAGGNDGADDGAGAPLRGDLAATGYELADATRTGVLLLAFGLVVVGLTRRRPIR